MQRSTIAPDWFQSKAVEVKGEGYPQLKDIPEARGDNKGGAAAWKTDTENLKAQAAQLEAQTTQPIPSDEDVRARAAQLRAQLESGQQPAGAAPAPKP